MTMSWYTMMEFAPPLVGCVISSRNYSFDLLRATRQCVLNIPTAELAVKVVGCGNSSGRPADKFALFQFTSVAASCVDAPLIAERYANLECRIVDTRWVSRYNFFVLDVLKAWIDPSAKSARTLHHRGRGVFLVAGKTIKLPSKMK